MENASVPRFCLFHDSFSCVTFHRFGELNADPSKAKKPHHRPKNARDFAVNYLAGYYSVIDSASESDAKSHK